MTVYSHNEMLNQTVGIYNCELCTDSVMGLYTSVECPILYGNS